MNEAASRLVGTAVAAGRIALTKHEAKSLLTAYGMPVPGGGLALSEAAAVAIARGLNGAVAMKAVGARIQHKTEGGLVVLGIDGAEATAETYRLLQTRGGDVLEGVLVEKMVSGNRELLVGLRRDPVFGPVVSFGLGGVMTQVLKDIVLARVPLTDRDVAELLDSIRAIRGLGSFRGAPPVDRKALSSIIRTVAQIALGFPEIAEIDINPLLVEGGTPVAADALVILDTPAAPTTGARASRAFELDLQDVFFPRPVAIIGASDDIRKWGGSALNSLLEGG